MKYFLLCVLVCLCTGGCSTATKRLMKNCEHKFDIDQTRVWECEDPNE